MVLSKRERNIVAVTLIAIMVFLLDRFALTPVLDGLSQLSADDKLYTDKLTNARSLFDHQKANEALWNQKIADGLKTDAADTEDALERAVYDWAQATNLTLKSCTPERVMQKDRPEVMLYVVGTGRMSAVAQFLYRAQTSKLPIKPESIEIGTRVHEGIDDLTLTAHFSGLYFPEGWKVSSAGGPAPVSGGAPK